jgi:dolichol-phosphate mannosyltransferase
MKSIVVTPTYNERENIPVLIERLSAHGVPVLVVDDGSPDGTAELAREAGAQVLEREGKLGLASAYVAGFQRALELGAERIVQMDADLSHDPDDVPRLIEACQGLALGSRYVEGGGTRNWPLNRRVLSRGGSLYSRLMLGLPQRDLTGGFKCWEASLLRKVLTTPVRSQGYAFQVEMTLRAVRTGAQVVEVPILFTERVEGASKMSRDIAIEAALVIPLLRFREG